MLRSLSLIILVLAIGACAGPQTSTTVSADDSAATATGPKAKVVLKEFSASGIAPEQVSGVSGKFCVEVAKCKKIDLVCAEDLKAILQHKEEMMLLGACDQEDCMAKIGQVMEAQYVVAGTINQVGQTLVLNVNLVDGPTGKIKSRFSREVPADKVEQLLDAVTAVAAELSTGF